VKGNTLILVPEIGTPTARSGFAGMMQNPSVPQVHFEEHQEAHSFFMYTKHQETQKLAVRSLRFILHSYSPAFQGV